MAEKRSLSLLLASAIVAGVFLVPARADTAEDDVRSGKIFAYYSTTSVTKLTTTTITGLTTCFSTASQAAQGACQGRKKRMLPVPMGELFNMEVDGLTSSLDDGLEVEDLVKRDAEGRVREAKKLTIWSTNYTTITVTSTSIQSLTTVSATALCTYPNQSESCFGAAG